EEGFSVEQTYDHGYAFLGFTNSFGNGGYDVYLVRTDSNGVFQWQRTYGGADWDFGYSIRQLADSGFVIVGQTYSIGQGNGDVYVIRADRYGDTLWTKAIGGTGYDVANSVTLFRDSLYFIAGTTTSFGLGDTDMYVIKMNNNGVVEKDTTFGSTHVDKASSIRLTSNNNLLIYGSSDTVNPGSFSEVMIKLDSNCHYTWSPTWQIYTCSGNSIGSDAVELLNGNIITMGTSNCNGSGGYDMHIQITQSAGWWITGPNFGGTNNEQGISIAVGKNDYMFFAGSSDSPGYTNGLYNVFTVCVDTIQNSALYTFVIYNYKDTSICTLGIASNSVIPPGVKIFPDPITTTATMLVQGDIGEHYSVNVYSNLGQQVITMPLMLSAHGQSIGHIEKTGLAPGTYMYVIVNKEGDRVGSGKFIVD
ncbi:MAG TPA: T9SS type A sorting domain-containing protein, partial [Bacteroidia bacterium]|nr:T9SS type A sorting domain-containing protein [Bacteroidia bacterium]